MSLRVVCISDTHSMHRKVKLPLGDVLIHAGDFCGRGLLHEVEDLADWLTAQPHEHKLIVPGNHDACAEDNPKAVRNLIESVPGTRLLIDELVSIKGVNFWGSPVTPRFGNWSFMKPRGDHLKKHWDQIPLDADVVITHGPAFGILDRVPALYGPLPKHAGCIDLLLRIREIYKASGRTRPRVHVCGHIHDGHGIAQTDDFGRMTFINASICTESYRPTNSPQEFVIEALDDG